MSRLAKQIMVVDDEPDIATVIKSGLESHGFVVNAFDKLEDALANFKAGNHDMLITDIKLPFMSGFDLHHEVKRVDYNIRVAFMTSFQIYENEFRKMFKDIEVTCFVKKPGRISDLVTRINEEFVKIEIKLSK